MRLVPSVLNNYSRGSPVGSNARPKAWPSPIGLDTV